MTIEQIKNKLQYGDYTTLGQMFNVAPTTAKMRFLRGDEEAKGALEKIIESREQLIQKFKQSENDK